jgi:hypothetical protein
MLISKKSQATGVWHTMNVNASPEKLKEWEGMKPSDRPYIQDFFPELNADEREFLLTGVTPEEWNRFFGEDE